MTDFRALCAELLQPLAEYDDHNPYKEHRALITRARALLAQPEPEGPTDQEIADTFAQGCREGAGNPDQPPFLAAARAVLARWGRPAIEPVPVSERPILKSSPFNNSDGHCWCGTSDFIDEHGDRPVSYPASWELREPCSQDDCVVPYWALPVPTPANNTREED